MSKVSLSIVEILESLCSSIAVYVSSLKFCTAIFYSDIIGDYTAHNARGFSVILFPWVKKTDVLSDRIIVCSITRLQRRSVQNWFVRRRTSLIIEINIWPRDCCSFPAGCWFQIVVVSCCCKYWQNIVNLMIKIDPRRSTV